MQILKTTRFLEELEEILDFIAQDSLTQALRFFEKLDEVIFSLPDMPLKCRQSTKSNDANVRDLIFHGYVIPYRINRLKDRLEIIGIFSENEWGM